MDKMRIAIILILTCIIIISTTCLAATGIVNAPSGLVLRETPSKNANPLTTVPDDANVEIIEKDGEWYKVKYGNYEGYLFAEYVKAQEEISTESTDEVEEQNEKEITSPNVEVQVPANESATYPQEINLTVDVKAYIIPSITSRVILNIETGKTITLNSELNNWFNISFEGKTYWIRKNNITIATNTENSAIEENTNTEETNQPEEKTTETAIENKKGYINVTSSANIRESASTTARVMNTLTRNTEVTIIGESGDFYKIQYQNITGYIAKSLISDTAVEVTSRSSQVERTPQTENMENTKNSETTQTAVATTQNTSSGGQQIAEYAKQYIGYGYSYGGTNPNSGFDCSGFAQYVYSSCGYSIGRTASQQLGYGNSVSKDELAVGDLVFFNNTSDGSVGHVGIYIGGNMIVHSANPRRGVTTDTIASGYYSNYYYTARRIVN